MASPEDLDQLQAYLDGPLSAEEVAALETRLKVEPALAEAFMILAREEVALSEWARVANRTNQLTERVQEKSHQGVPMILRYRWVASMAAALLIAASLTS